MNLPIESSQYRNIVARKFYNYLHTAKEEGGYKVYIPPLFKNKRYIPDFVVALVKSRDIIEKLGLDPVVYYKAQLRAFEQRQKKKNSMLYPRFLWNKGAVKRVQKWMVDAKERYGTTDISSVPDTRKDVEKMIEQSKAQADYTEYERILAECGGNKLVALCLSTSVCRAQFLVDRLIEIPDEHQDDFIEFVKVQDPIKYEQIKSILSK